MIQDLRKNQTRKKGFTLIELLVVITIVAILSLVVSTSFLNSQKKGRDVARKTDLKNLSDALNMYYSDNGYFPGETTINSLISNQGEFSETTSSGNKIVYMKKVPNEGISGMKSFLYEVSSDQKSFKLYADLENKDDKDCVDKTTCSSLGYSISNECCYVVTSSNIGITEILK